MVFLSGIPVYSGVYMTVCKSTSFIWCRFIDTHSSFKRGGEGVCIVLPNSIYLICSWKWWIVPDLNENYNYLGMFKALEFGEFTNDYRNGIYFHWVWDLLYVKDGCLLCSNWDCLSNSFKGKYQHQSRPQKPDLPKPKWSIRWDGRKKLISPWNATCMLTPEIKLWLKGLYFRNGCPHRKSFSKNLCQSSGICLQFHWDQLCSHCNSFSTSGNAGQVFHLTPPCHFDLQACQIALALGIETGRDFQCK